jgi:hypothetical protein
MNLQCECKGCTNHEGRCQRHDGQQDLFLDEPVRLFKFKGQHICKTCLPRPVAVGGVNYNLKEDERLKRQDTLFLFY